MCFRICSRCCPSTSSSLSHTSHGPTYPTSPFSPQSGRDASFPTDTSLTLIPKPPEKTRSLIAKIFHSFCRSKNEADDKYPLSPKSPSNDKYPSSPTASPSDNQYV